MEQSITVQSLSSLTNICQISVIWKASCHSFSSLVEKGREIMLALILQLCSSSTQALVFTSVHVNLPVIQVSSPVTAEPDVPSKNCWCPTTRNHNAFSDAPSAARSEARAVHAAISSCYDSATNFLQSEAPFPNELSAWAAATAATTPPTATLHPRTDENETRCHWSRFWCLKPANSDCPECL